MHQETKKGARKRSLSLVGPCPDSNRGPSDWGLSVAVGRPITWHPYRDPLNLFDSVVMRHRGGATLLQWQPGLGAVPRLHWVLLVTAAHQRVLGR